LLFALGPQFLFKVCPVMVDMIMKRHWSAAQAEMGARALIAALGIALTVFASTKTRLGLTIGILLSGVLALLIPHVLIGGCSSPSMQCRKIAFPAITAISILLLIGSGLYTLYLARKKE
jgi:putative Ca2+/H+ antiporter (TMEM165/GDT1 family)